MQSAATDTDVDDASYFIETGVASCLQDGDRDQAQHSLPPSLYRFTLSRMICCRENREPVEYALLASSSSVCRAWSTSQETQ